VNSVFRKSPSGSIGSFTRASIATNRRAGGRRGELGDDRRAAPTLLVPAQQREDEEEEAADEGDLAGPVDAARLRVARLAHPAVRGGDRGDPTGTFT
jgi:hypothetical protein